MERLSHQVTISAVKGTHFEVGVQLGQKATQKFGPNYIDSSLKVIEGESLYDALGLRSDLPPAYVDNAFPVIESLIKTSHPQLLDEVHGFAQALGEDFRRTLVFLCNYDPSGCSQFFVNGFLARNYDDSPHSVENEFSLLSPEGSYTSFGSSTSYVERLDGINEKGLAVSLTFGAGNRPANYGIGAPMFLRILLDKAATVEEALAIFDKVKYVAPNNVIIADTSRKSVIIEQSAGQYAIRQSDGGIFYCGNRYLSPEMQKQQKLRNGTTIWREKQMEAKGVSLDTAEGIMDFLTTDFPQGGLYEPYFTDGLGTLWSVIYKPETGEIYLAIGEKDNGRQSIKFNLSDPDSFKRLPLILRTTLDNIQLGTRIKEYLRASR